MELIALIVTPLLFAAAAYAIPAGQRGRRVRPLLLPVASCIHAWFALRLVRGPTITALGGWLEVDALGKLVLGVITIVFFCCFLYLPYYLRMRSAERNRVFCVNLLCLLSAVSLAVCAQHFGVMWVALEATTLCTAPLLYFNRTARALEAAWKYMLVCSVGIALALLGTFFLAYSSLHAESAGGPLTGTLMFVQLRDAAPLLTKGWLHAAFAMLLIGYGTKLGLAPMHTWKPDAYGEACGVVGTLLAATVTSAAFLAISRCVAIMHAAGEFAFARNLLVALGLLSMLVAAVFMIGQRDIKRMLAYSSVEHMGILVIGLGIGGLGSFAAFYHLMNNAFTKGIVFLAAGNIHRSYGSKNLDQVKGALERLPISAVMLLIGFIAVTGSPPFAPFMSEFTLIRAAFDGHQYWIAGSFLVFIMVIFVGMSSTVLNVVLGTAPAELEHGRKREELFAVLPMFLFLGLVLILGVHLPDPVRDIISGAVKFLEKTP